MRHLALGLIASALAVVACGGSGSDQNAPIPPTYTISMEDTRFDPERQAVEIGKELTWRNEDDAPHDVDFVAGGEFRSDPVGKGGAIVYTPQRAGTIYDVCSVHPSMTGTLVVEER